MRDNIIILIASLVAGIIVMIVHELPKSVIYILDKTDRKKYIGEILNFKNYIDLLGLVFFVINYTGFSRPYMFGIKEKKMNIRLGVMGFLSMIILFSINVSIINLVFHNPYLIIINYDITKLIEYIAYLLAVFSISMIVSNLFPIYTFDISLIIAGKYPDKYFLLIQNDFYVKIIWILLAVFGVQNTISRLFLSIFL